MLLLFWSPRPVELALPVAGSSDADLLAGLETPTGLLVSDASSAATVLPGLTYALLLRADGAALADLTAVVRISTLYESGAGSDAEGKFTDWDRVRMVIDTFEVEMRVDALEP